MKIKFDKIYRDGYIIVKYNKHYVLRHITVECYATQSWALDAFYIRKDNKTYMVTLTNRISWNDCPLGAREYILNKRYMGMFVGWYDNINLAIYEYNKLKGDNK